MSRKELIIGLALALALRLGFCFYTIPRDSKPLDGADSYAVIATNLVQRGEYSEKLGLPAPTAAREPGYPLFLAAIYALLSSRPWVVAATLSLLSTATVWLIYALAAAAFHGRGARLAFWAAAIYPYFIYYNAYYHSFRETLLSFLAALMLFLLVRFETPAGALAAGAAGGWLCLANFSWTPGAALLGLWIGLQKNMNKLGLKRAASFFLPVVLMLGAWTARNWRVFGSFIPGSTMTGLLMYQAFYLPEEMMATDQGTLELSRDPVWLSVGGLPEAERNKALIRSSFKIAYAQPARSFIGLVRRLFLPWHVLPRELPYTHNTALLRLAALLSDGWILPLSLLGLWRERKNSLAQATLLLLLSLTAAYSLTRAPIRYRVPLMPALLVFAGRGAQRLIRDERIPI